jgi:hypothetical protein
MDVQHQTDIIVLCPYIPYVPAVCMLRVRIYSAQVWSREIHRVRSALTHVFYVHIASHFVSRHLLLLFLLLIVIIAIQTTHYITILSFNPVLPT